ncbi:MAG: sensor domain-containing diguanylate cyclase [Gammaproteobacteria bacterium]|nr:sensor domain-containing diguanylate cyclase [Gammaproteobacteria bacterium]
MTVAALGALAVLATALVYAMLELMSGGRAYVHGEGRWSKAQQAVVFHLDRYAETGEREHLAEARDALQVPLGDREARLALQGPAYDYARAYDGLLRGENHPSDIPTMIWLFEHFENVPYFRRAIRTWGEADAHIIQLRDLAARLQDAWSPGRPDPAVLAGLRRELIDIDRRLRPLENAFSRVLGKGLLQLKRVFGVLSAVLFLVFAGALLVTFRWAVRHISASERKFWATVQHAPVGVALVDGHGRFTHINDTLCTILGYERESLMGLSFADILVPEQGAGRDVLFRRAADAGDTGVTLEVRCLRRNGEVLWCKLNLAPFPDHHNDGAHVAAEYIATLEDVSEARQLSEQLTYQAAHDPLTGLLNRRRFETDLEDALEHAGARGLRHTLGFVDLNDFKQVNDSAGHLAGDKVLETVAMAMRRQLRTNDSLARVGGDEFGFILHGCDIQRGLETAEKLHRAVNVLDIEWEGLRFRVSVSIGLVELSEHTRDPVAALQAADRACYLAKNEGGTGIRVDAGEAAGEDSGAQGMSSTTTSIPPETRPS